VNALQLPGFREALSLPDQAEQTLSLRTQQVLMYETDITKYGDIFEGSKVIENLTDETAACAREIAMKLRAPGYTRALELVGAELTRLLAERQARIESGEIVQVGVNSFPGEIRLSSAPATTADDSAQRSAERERIDALLRWRQTRDSSAV